MRIDILRFEYTALLFDSFDQKCIICVNNIDFLKNRFYTLCEVFIVELVLAAVTIYQLCEYLPELMKQSKRNTKMQDVTKKHSVVI